MRSAAQRTDERGAFGLAPAPDRVRPHHDAARYAYGSAHGDVVA